jgi:tRNA(Ile)-lysidine synthase TilS/MesJ
MVCSLLLFTYCLEKNIKIIGVCINYNNREEQKIEIEMISKWLRLLNIEFHVRNIFEINRKRDKDRDFYEKITRNIRFETYKKFNCPVILGHNKDDSVENIFSNIIKKKNYNNLLGMTHTCIENNVLVFRPLLNIFKKDIIDFANNFNVPFVYDSTPSWSERGKLRDILIPDINNFNNKITEGLIEIAHNFYKIYQIYNKSLPNIIFSDNNCIIEDNEIYFFDYWKNIFQKITRHYNLPNIKNKCIQFFVNYVKNGNRITLNKYLIAKKNKEKIVINII